MFFVVLKIDETDRPLTIQLALHQNSLLQRLYALNTCDVYVLFCNHLDRCSENAGILIFITKKTVI